jgi:hypothetical protein
MRKHPTIKGFTLIKDYLGCNRKIGDYEPLTSGLYLNFPEFWEPVYYDDIRIDMNIDKILRCDNNN